MIKAEKTNTGMIICSKHKCDLESERGKLYCPECRKDREKKLNRVEIIRIGG